MNQYTLATVLIAAAGITPSATCAAATDSYSFMRHAVSARDMTVAVSRDGPRETIKLSRANGWRSRMWFDFVAHRQYAEDSNAPGTCSVIDYASDGPPELLDPVPGAFDMAKQVPTDAPGAGKEKLGGINTRVIAMPGGGKVWIDDAHHLVIKLQVVMQGNPKPQTMIDLTGIRFDKPDAATLNPPAHCKAIQGSANAHGGHADVLVNAH